MNPRQQSFVVEGLAGARTLRGSVRIKGAKNAALKAMAASVLFDGPVELHNVPENADVITMSAVLEKLGAKVERRAADEALIIDPSGISSTDIDPELAASMRASVVLTGPLLARFGKASFPAPGGCVIGTRPIDQFEKGYRALGAAVEETDGLYRIELPAGKKLRGTEIFFNKQTVGGTETLMMAAVLAEGTTVLKNCALEPEIVNTAEWLNACGAKISGAGSTTMTIEGTGGKLLSAAAAPATAAGAQPYVAIPDRIEAGSFVILGALCAEELHIEKCEPLHLEALISLLRGAGAVIETGPDSITVRGGAAAAPYTSFNVTTHEYPGFPTDLQAPLVTFLTQASGESIVFETIFEGRFKYTEDLIKMGADIISMNAREILVKGPAPLRELPAISDKNELRAHDIRAGFAVVLAALVGSGTFTINNIHLIDRGYEKLEEKLGALGAKIGRVTI